MTQLEFKISKRGPSQNKKLMAYFKARPGQWISLPELGNAMGGWAVHSRAADLRKKFGMTIENRGMPDPLTGKILSEYRYVPPAEPWLKEAFESAKNREEGPEWSKGQPSIMML